MTVAIALHLSGEVAVAHALEIPCSPNAFAALAKPRGREVSRSATFDEIRSLKAEPAALKLVPKSPRDVLNDRVNLVRQSLQRLVELQYDVDAGDFAGLAFGKWSTYVPFEEKIPAHAIMKSASDWSRGVNYIESDAEGRSLSVDLLQEIHRRACQHIEFHGYEGRRIAKKLRDGEISKDEFRKRLDRAYKGEAVSGTDHRTLVGHFRSDPIDQLSHRGSQQDSQGRRYFTEAEFTALEKNVFLKLRSESVQRDADGKIRAEFQYLDVTKVQSAVVKILDTANREIEAATTLEQKVHAVVMMQRNLLSAHPFLDGNGRSVRLLGDLLYRRFGLPVPARPNERDLEMVGEEAVEFVREQMIRTLNIERRAVEP